MVEVFAEWTACLRGCSVEEAEKVVKLRAGLHPGDFDDKDLQHTIGVLNEEKKGLYGSEVDSSSDSDSSSEEDGGCLIARQN